MRTAVSYLLLVKFEEYATILVLSEIFISALKHNENGVVQVHQLLCEDNHETIGLSIKLMVAASGMTNTLR